MHIDYKIDPNPFVVIASALGAKFDTAQAKPSEDKVGDFHWSPLTGQANSPLWLAIGRIPIDVNSVDRITVRYKDPQATSGGSSSSGKSSSSDKSSKSGASTTSGSAKSDQPDECVSKVQEAKDKTVKHVESKKTGGDVTDETTYITETKETVENKPQYSGDFLAANGFFSDSPDDFFAVSFALGLTAHAQDTSIASGGSDVGINGYLLAKLYIKNNKPRLHAGPESYMQGYRGSLGLFIGSNIKKDAFNELVGGLSFGNLLGGRGGILLGANWIAAKDTSSGRKVRPFIGLEYTF